jgi:phage gpG-like protein
MAEAISISIEGVKQVQDTLDKLARDLESNLELNKELSTTLSKKASVMAPKLTGALASSVVGNPSADKAQIVAGSAAVPYAGVQEYGWPSRNIEAQPYLRPAVYDNMEYIVEKYNDNIEKAIKKYNLD